MFRFAKLAIVVAAMTATSAYAAAPAAMTNAVSNACCPLGACCGMSCC